MNNKNQIARPVAWAATNEEGNVEALGMNQSRRFDTPLYTAAQVQAMPAAAPQPPSPVEPAQPLTEPAISHCISQSHGEPRQMRVLARVIERQCAAAWGVELDAEAQKGVANDT